MCLINFKMNRLDPQVNLLLSYSFFFNMCFRKLMVDLRVPFGFYSGNCFGRVVVLFNSRICI